MESDFNTRANGLRVLVADDDPAIVELVSAILELEGFAVTGVSNGEKAVSMVRDAWFDLVILDVMMPEMDGFEACRRIRQDSEVPIIFLSAKSEELDQVVGLTLDGDDYIAKPFKPRELVARVRACLRRAKRGQQNDELMCIAGIELDPRAHTAILHETDLALTPKEFDLLAVLLRNAGRPVSAHELFEQVWREPYRANDSNTIMVHMRRLRRKIAAIDSSQAYIETVFGVGYKLLGDKKGRDEG